MQRWADIAGADRGTAYSARFARLARSGADLHGEADRCARLVDPGARVLDAGCGTGRVAIRLAELGFRCTGVDSDELMLAEARRLAPDLDWLLADLADYRPAAEFDLVVCAGNVIPLLRRGTEAQVLVALAGGLCASGTLVTGFGLDAAHLPLAEAPFGLARYDSWCVDAGLRLAARYATWSGEPFDGGGYAVSVHRSA